MPTEATPPAAEPDPPTQGARERLPDRAGHPGLPVNLSWRSLGRPPLEARYRSIPVIHRTRAKTFDRKMGLINN